MPAGTRVPRGRNAATSLPGCSFRVAAPALGVRPALASARDRARASDRAPHAQAPTCPRARRRLPRVDGRTDRGDRPRARRPPSRELNRRINELERQIKPLVAALAPALLAIPGCGAPTAAKIVGETAGIARFRSKSAYARWNGTAPQPASSATTNRFRLNRGGNRQVNAALHRVAITQARTSPQGRDFIAKRIRQGNSRTEALRVLRAPTLRRRLPHPAPRRARHPARSHHQSQRDLT
jgi:hypothetical protein